MNAFLAELRETLVPGRATPFGPLPPLLIAMTVVTGLVDAFSYLVLGHVFVANMTGNVVFLGFAVAGAHGFSISASLVALVSFGVGSVIGGRIVARYGSHRGRHLATAMVTESVFLATSVVLALWSSNTPQHAFRYALIVALSLARCPKRQYSQAGGARPHHDGVDHDRHRHRCGQCPRWGEGVQIGSATPGHRRHVRRSAVRSSARPPRADRCPPCHCPCRHRPCRSDELRGGQD